MSGRRRVPSSWVSPAESAKASVRLQRALRSRLQGYTGTSATPRLRRYYKNLAELEATVRRLHRAGADVEGQLLAIGSVYVTSKDSYQQFEAIEVIRQFIRGPDTSPHHFRDTQLPAPTRELPVEQQGEQA